MSAMRSDQKNGYDLEKNLIVVKMFIIFIAT